MMKSSILLCLVSALVGLTWGQNIVDIPELGKLKGLAQTTTVLKRTYYQFSGIPYGQNPAGENRFLPVDFPGRLTNPNDPEDVFDATKFMPQCPQPSTVGLGRFGSPIDNETAAYASPKANLRAVTGQENCLGINVYTTEVPTSADAPLKPVIFFIHGGAFSLGASNTYTGKKLLDKDVVLVTINYRLGVLGFFSLDINEAPGNAALFDMLLALQWVNRYISYFGGNPNRVILAGQSAGSAAVSHLMASHLTRGLFHGAIAMSGSSLSEWAVEPEPKKHALAVAALAGCAQTDPDGQANLDLIARCMREVPVATIVDAFSAYQKEERRNGRLGFGVTAPIVQQAGAVKFHNKHPLEIFSNNEQAQVPLLAGCMQHDGSFVLGEVYNGFLKPNNHLADSHFLKTDLVPRLLDALGIRDGTYAIYEALADSYIGRGIESGDFDLMKTGLIDLHSVFFFKGSSYRAMQLHSRHNPSYWYSFEYKGRWTLYSLLFGFKPPPIPGGIAHGDELLYIFHLLYALNGNEAVVSQKMVDMWTNFAISGHPTPAGAVYSSDGSAMVQWPAYNNATNLYLTIGKEEIHVSENYPTSWVGAADYLGPVRPPPASCESYWNASMAAGQAPQTLQAAQPSPLVERDPKDNGASSLVLSNILLAAGAFIWNVRL